MNDRARLKESEWVTVLSFWDRRQRARPIPNAENQSADGFIEDTAFDHLLHKPFPISIEAGFQA